MDVCKLNYDVALKQCKAVCQIISSLCEHFPLIDSSFSLSLWIALVKICLSNKAHCNVFNCVGYFVLSILLLDVTS